MLRFLGCLSGYVRLLDLIRLRNAFQNYEITIPFTNFPHYIWTLECLSEANFVLSAYTPDQIEPVLIVRSYAGAHTLHLQLEHLSVPPGVLCNSQMLHEVYNTINEVLTDAQLFGVQHEDGNLACYCVLPLKKLNIQTVTKALANITKDLTTYYVLSLIAEYNAHYQDALTAASGD